MKASKCAFRLVLVVSLLSRRAECTLSLSSKSTRVVPDPDPEYLEYGADTRIEVRGRICKPNEENKIFINDNMCGMFQICERGHRGLKMYQYICPDDQLFDHLTMMCQPDRTCALFLKAMVVAGTGHSLKRICPNPEKVGYTYLFHNAGLTEESCGEYEECTGPHQHVTRRCPSGTTFDESLGLCDKRMSCSDFLPKIPIDCSERNKHRLFWQRDTERCNRAWICRNVAADTDEYVPYYQWCKPGYRVNKPRSRSFECVRGGCASRKPRIVYYSGMEEIVSCDSDDEEGY